MAAGSTNDIAAAFPAKWSEAASKRQAIMVFNRGLSSPIATVKTDRARRQSGPIDRPPQRSNVEELTFAVGRNKPASDGVAQITLGYRLAYPLAGQFIAGDSFDQNHFRITISD